MLIAEALGESRQRNESHMYLAGFLSLHTEEEYRHLSHREGLPEDEHTTF
jgi:hypothetical protein